MRYSFEMYPKPILGCLFLERCRFGYGPAPKNGQILTNHSPTSHASNKNRSPLKGKALDLRVFMDVLVW